MLTFTCKTRKQCYMITPVSHINKFIDGFTKINLTICDYNSYIAVQERIRSDITMSGYFYFHFLNSVKLK